MFAADDFFDLSNSESPESTGRAVAALAADPDLRLLSDGPWSSPSWPQRYGFTDVDGRRPTSLRPTFSG